MPNQNVYSNPIEVTAAFALDFAGWVNATNGTFYVALSGGSTPKLLFEHWSSQDAPDIDWNKVHFFWGDERCVPPDDPESNFGVVNQLFFQPMGISDSNIHRVFGEKSPAAECARYSERIQSALSLENQHPKFDLVILGMGTDGHTASIFPNQIDLLDSSDVCAVATHPETGQQRVTITGSTIENAKRIAFLITGDSKAEKIAAILSETPESKEWPATHFFSLPQTRLYLDEAASKH